MRTPSRRARLGVLLLLAACRAPSGAAVGGDAPAAAAAPGAGCPTHKLRFDRDTACRNDGYLEFCVPKGDPALDGRIRAVAPTAEQASDWHGRARCDDARETHWALPTRDPAMCSWDGITDAGWETICRLAALPEIQVIVPTIWLR